MEDKAVVSLLSICMRASRMELGYDQSKQAMLDGRAHLILIASDLSSGAKKRIGLLEPLGSAEIKELPMTMDEIWYSIGRRAGVLAITDKGFADRLRELMGRVSKEEQN